MALPLHIESPSLLEDAYARLLEHKLRHLRMKKSLKTLLKPVEVISTQGDLTRQINGLSLDSRRILPGRLFFAVKGVKSDGNVFIQDAIARGAVAIVTESDLPTRASRVPFIQVKSMTRAISQMAQVYFGHPAKAMKLLGITGTNGKTTVAYLLRYLLDCCNRRAGMLGTVEYSIGQRTLPAARTTPDALESNALLGQMKTGGCDHAIMEVSSHGLDQGRVYALPFDTAIFLNLTQDHLDYHQDMESYFKVKARLFNGGNGSLPSLAIINRDDPYGEILETEMDSASKCLSFSQFKEADVRATEVELSSLGSAFNLLTPEGEYRVESPLLGRYNVSNVLAALTVMYAHGFPMDVVVDSLARFNGVPGRMERINETDEFTVLVDYAHTDDALMNALKMLKPITQGRILLVFGCGGNRDRSKRVPMVRAAIDGADLVWATADNPRGEALDQIFSDMKAGVSDSDPVTFVDDRRWAIHMAVKEARPGDTLLIAGKGHETYQELDHSVIPFDDRQVVRDLIRKRFYRV